MMSKAVFIMTLCQMTCQMTMSVANSTPDKLTELIPGCSKTIPNNNFNCPSTTTTSSSLHSQECIRITGFSTRDFAASGIYCKLEDGPYQLRVSDTLRYELLQRNSNIFELLRVIKSKRAWVGVAIYAALLNKDGVSLEHAEWRGYSLDAKEGDLVFDPTEPNLNATYIEAPSSYIAALSIANDYRSQQINACDISMCESTLTQPSISDEFCLHYWRATAQLAEMTGNNLEAASRHQQARSCVQDDIHMLASKQVPIPRHLRWRIGEISHHIAKSWVKAGMFQAALDEVLIGLEHTPEQKQRRLLLVSLGDLRIAANNLKGAMSAYQQALNAVLLKGGMVEEQSFWSYFQDSVGDLIAQVLPSQTHLKGSDILSNYTAVRMNMLLSVRTEQAVDELNFLVKNDTMLPLGHECILESPTETPELLDFCTYYRLRHIQDLDDPEMDIE